MDPEEETVDEWGQHREEEKRINKLLNDNDERNMHSQGTKNLIDEIQRFVQENQALDSLDPITHKDAAGRGH